MTPTHKPDVSYLERQERERIQAAAIAAKERWLSFFDTIMYAFLDMDMDETRAIASVQKAALVADAALKEFEDRWPA